MNSLVKHSYAIANRFDESLNGIKFKNEDRNIVASSFFSISLEHHRSIIVLIENQLYGSASTLLRSIFESYVKGMWFFHCSSQKDIEKLRKDKFDLKFSLLIEGIENECGKGISKPKKENWSNLNSLTHAGAAQISRRVEDTCIKSSYSDDFVKDTLNFSNNYALLCAGELAKISNNAAAQECVLEIAKKLELR